MPDTIEERLRRLRAQQGQSIEERLAALRAAQPAQQGPQGMLDTLRQNLGIAGHRGMAPTNDFVNAAGDIISGALTGDFQPLKEVAKGVALRAQQLYAASQPGGQAAVGVAQAAIDRGAAEREAGQVSRGDVYPITSAVKRRQLNELAAQDPSLTGKITRRGLEAGVASLPYLAASPGGAGALAAVGALSSLGEPENIPISAGLAALPLPSGRAIAAGARGLFGRGAAQAVEAGAQQVLPGFESAVAEAAGAVPQSMTRKILGNTLEGYRLIRAAKTSGDISAPLRQGALLTLSPSQWVNGAIPRAAVRMFKAFRSKDYAAIQRAIGEDLDGQVFQRFGGELTTQATDTGLRRTEEVFLSKWSDKIPVIKQSEQAYKTFLDSVRLDRFKGYKAAIDKAGLSREQTERAYKAAADWINTATGRGSFGKTIDKTLPVLGEVLFAPRNVASRLAIMNPWTYAKNARTAEGRVVLKEQMKDLLQFAGVVAGTLQLAKLAGAEVNTSYNSPDFLKIKVGNWRYDPLAGMQQVMRLVARTGADLNRAVHNEPPAKRGETALGIAGHFLRSKLAPVPGAFTSFIERRTYTGQPFSAKKELIELYAPLQWADFLDAYQAEGLGGVVKSSPGLLGVGVQNYAQRELQRQQQLK